MQKSNNENFLLLKQKMAVKKNLPQISIPKSNDINGKNSSNMPKSNEIEKKENENEKKDSDIMILKKTEFIPDLKKYKKLGFLGQGSSGIVEKAIYEPSNTLLALKVLNKQILILKKFFIEYSFKF